MGPEPVTEYQHSVRLEAAGCEHVQVYLRPGSFRLHRREARDAPALEFITSVLLGKPQRVDKPLRAPLDRRWSGRRGQYRVIYTIEDSRSVVEVLQLSHRGVAYR